ncbi:DUF3224 domain-containing protein [Nocardia crassostreae]|uniref:DUF3224 domain-containing protein n=1 Tax=Nocardia crassostreae TaxID=53428 RepID=UPI000833DC21|nr:DUF3224 domain-containing protein [Nocardia crassostreae]
MRASGTFTVKSFTPAEVAPDPAITTGMPVGVALMEKHFEGEISGRAATVFTSAYDEASGAGTYLAMESFEGSVGGRTGACNFAHSASTTGSDRSAEFFVIVAGSGTDELTGITGTGGIAVDADGTHRIWFDYELS